MFIPVLNFNNILIKIQSKNPIVTTYFENVLEIFYKGLMFALCFFYQQKKLASK